MSRVSRMMLIVGLMVLVGLSALFFMAKRLRTAVEQAPAGPAALVQPVVDDPIPMQPGETAAQAAGIAEPVPEPAPESAPEPAPRAEQPAEQPLEQPAAPAVDPLQDRIAIFAEGRQAIRDWMEKYPKIRDSIQKELTDTVDTERVRMYNYEFMEIRLARARPLRAAGMEEEEYFTIREQYRAYRAGTDDLDPAYQAAFEAAPAGVMDRADLGEYEGLDY